MIKNRAVLLMPNKFAIKSKNKESSVPAKLTKVSKSKVCKLLTKW